jgi:hypothetical protein
MDCGFTTPCWVWQRSTYRTGYGQIRGSSSAHRYYYEEAYGEVPKGLHLDHLCRVRACVNPDHLEPVTCAENIRRGAKTKLTPKQVLEIRASTLSRREIADSYGIRPQTVTEIRGRRCWGTL